MRRQIRFAQCLAAVVAVLMLSAITALAATPSLISIQGKLTDAGGIPPLPGAKSFVFRIFNASAGGTQIWPTVGGEAQSISTNADGLWTGQLGAVNPLTDVVFADTVSWLEITVNGELLSPRVRLVTGTYAMRVATLDGATGGGVTGNLYLKGTATGPAGGAYVQFNDGSGTAMGYVGDGGGTDQDLYFYAYVGNVRLTTSAGIVLTVGSSGNVGIGAAPLSVVRLYVQTSGTTAVYGFSSGLNGNGTIGTCSNGSGAYGIWGVSSSGYAGKFDGNVDVDGTLTKNAGSFKIDHPLDPANKYLSHSFVESPDMMNMYNGNVTLDAKGEAVIELMDWFGALNKDIRYQLTAIGAPGPNLYVAQKVSGNQFRIAGGSAGMEVSWQLTGIRQDAYANAHRIPVEELKPNAERGFYRNPELFSQPEEKGIEWARHPETMKQMKEERDKATDK